MAGNMKIEKVQLIWKKNVRYMTMLILMGTVCLTSFGFSSGKEIKVKQGMPMESELHSLSAVLMDGHSGRILYEKDGYEILPMASTTKIMTCILALEHGDLDDMLTVSSYASSMPQVRLGVCSGERYRLEDLLYSLMLESHNDAAVVIAEGIAGSVEAFAEMMNQKARDVGAYHLLVSP